MTHNYQPAWEVYKKSRNLVSTHWKLFALIYIFPLIGALLSGYDRFRHVHITHSNWSVFLKSSVFGGGTHDLSQSALFVTFVAVLSFVSGLALAVAATRYAHGKKPDLGQVVAELMDKGVRLILLTILSGIITVVGFILLVIPGVFILGRLYLSQYILIYEDTGVIEAMEKSWHMTKGRMWAVYSLILLTLLFAFVSVIPVVGPLLSTVLALSFGVGPALRYFELKQAKKK